VLVLVFAVVFAAFTPAGAANPVNDTCFDCHADRDDPEVPFVDGGVSGRRFTRISAHRAPRRRRPR
jgi:hypothetical protein